MPEFLPAGEFRAYGGVRYRLFRWGIVAVDRHPNHCLRRLLAETGWTGDRLARAVNQIGTECGLSLNYQRWSVSQWLAGTQPRPPAPTLLVEALSRELGRTISPADAGLDDRTAAAPQPTLTDLQGSLDGRLVSLARHSGDPDLALPCDLSVWTAVLGERHRRSGARSRTHSARPGAGERLRPPSVDGSAAMVQVFSAADQLYGGGQARTALAVYLAETTAPMLRAPGPPSLRSQALTTAAQLAYLCGFMHFDDDLQGLAQRYYLTSLELAEAADDPVGQSLALRGLSVQAHALHRPGRARDLAQAAVDRSSGQAPPALRASLLGQLAVAEAAGGNRPAVADALRRAERALSGAPDASSAVGAYNLASLDHQRGVTAVHAEDWPAAVAALRGSLRRRPPTEPRSRALVQARLARLQYRLGHAEAAMATWEEFLDSSGHVLSRRVEREVEELVRLVRRHRGRPVADRLLQRADRRRTG